MTTYRLTPMQMTQLAFALGAAAASESDQQGIGDCIRLANKVSQGCAQGSLSCNHQETGRLLSAIETASSAVKNAGTEYRQWLQELGEAIRAGSAEQQVAAGVGAAGTPL